jgi:hypothetical protein
VYSVLSSAGDRLGTLPIYKLLWYTNRILQRGNNISDKSSLAISRSYDMQPIIRIMLVGGGYFPPSKYSHPALAMDRLAMDMERDGDANWD